MKNNVKAFAVSLVVLVSLCACSQQKYDAETDEAIINQLEVVNREDGVYGNIYLPTEIEGATVTWKSANKKVIDAVGDEQKAPGVVYRQAEDTTVKLTAIIDKDGTKTQYEQDVLVKAAPEEIKDEDYKAYLFVHQ